MALQFRRDSLTFPPTTGRRQRLERTVTFEGTVGNFEAVLKGFFVRYNNGDHHILELEIDLDSVRAGSSAVTVFVDFVFRDSSGTFDDPYSGSVEFVVIADVT